MSEALLEMREITKSFPGVTANDHVSLDLRAGEIHALVGENGAGKTTLMKILYGLHRPDSGWIAVRGTRVSIRGPRDAIRRGIGMVHQHFMLFPPSPCWRTSSSGKSPGRQACWPRNARAGRFPRSWKRTSSSWTCLPGWRTCRWASSRGWRS